MASRIVAVAWALAGLIGCGGGAPAPSPSSPSASAFAPTTGSGCRAFKTGG